VSAGKATGVERSAARRAKNESIFRDANEAIKQSAQEHGLTDGAAMIPFLCECEEEACTVIVRMTLPEYEQVRGQPRRFLLSPGHESEPDRVISQGERFAVVEKTGEEGRLVAQYDPRS